MLERAFRSLPHGPEFRFLDRITELDPGVSGAGEYWVKPDDSFLRGHFPNQPLMPGVLMIEALAQLAGAVAQSDPKLRPIPNLRLSAVRRVKFLGTAAPGHRLQIQARIIGRLGNLVQASGAVRVESRLLVEGELTLGGESEG